MERRVWAGDDCCPVEELYATLVFVDSSPQNLKLQTFGMRVWKSLAAGVGNEGVELVIAANVVLLPTKARVRELLVNRYST